MNVMRITTISFIIFIFVFSLAKAIAQTQDYWPRVFVNADGSITIIPEKPQRILSTSVSITGSLLAINAPVIASATEPAGTYFGQWDHLAKTQNIAKLWPAGSIDLESVYAYEPDLIVVALVGLDSVRDQLDELRLIAPTVVVDYGGQSWQQLTTEMGSITGLENAASKRIVQFNQFMVQSKSQIKIPAGQANIISYNGPGTSNPIATAEGVHGQLLTDLGFDIESPDPKWQTASLELGDFVRSSYENLTLMKVPTTFLLNIGSDTREAFLADPVLANMPSVKAGQVYMLGANAFRIDYFNATELVEAIVQQFGADNPQQQ